jgi:transposase-like protein
MKLTMEQIINEHQTELKRNRKTASQYQKFSVSFKAKVARFIEEGGDKNEISNSLQVARTTLYLWTRKYSTKKSSSFKELRVSENAFEKKNYFTIETPSGFKINVDSQQKLVELVRALEMAS